MISPFGKPITFRPCRCPRAFFSSAAGQIDNLHVKHGSMNFRVHHLPCTQSCHVDLTITCLPVPGCTTRSKILAIHRCTVCSSRHSSSWVALLVCLLRILRTSLTSAEPFTFSQTHGPLSPSSRYIAPRLLDCCSASLLNPLSSCSAPTSEATAVACNRAEHGILSPNPSLYCAMRLPLFGPFLGLLLSCSTHISNAHSHESNLTYLGAPRFSIEGVLPVLEIAESYIRSQTDGNVKQIGAKGDGRCSTRNPCILGSCCNSDGRYPTIFPSRSLLTVSR